MPFLNKPAFLARLMATLALAGLIGFTVTAFKERNTFDRLDVLNGPTEASPVFEQPPTGWALHAEGGTSRLAVLLTDENSAWLGLAHGLKRTKAATPQPPHSSRAKAIGTATTA